MKIIAISLSPNDALFYKIRADCLGKLEKKEEAIDDYKQFVDLNDRKELSNIFRQNRITK
jgi:tetratricopeptide (TPR) repeat protein